MCERDFSERARLGKVRFFLALTKEYSKVKSLINQPIKNQVFGRN